MDRVWPADGCIVGLGGVFVKFSDFLFNRRLESRTIHLYLHDINRLITKDINPRKTAVSFFARLDDD